MKPIGRSGSTALVPFMSNDSKVPFGSRKDRHENLGEGEIGKKGLSAFLSEPRFEGLPATLETPGPDKKGPDAAQMKRAFQLRRQGLRRRSD
jgi:deoxyribonuclease-4